MIFLKFVTSYLIIQTLIMIEWISCELFSATVDLEQLVETENAIMRSLDYYINSREKSLNQLKRYASILKSQQNLASKDVEAYVSNPLNAYLLVKRLTVDWKKIENIISSPFEKDFAEDVKLYRKKYKFPTDDDLNGTIVGLTRLQDTYRLNTTLLANGELNGVKYSTELTAADCLLIGKQSAHNNDYYHSVLWKQEAANRIDTKNDMEQIDKTLLLEEIATAHIKEDNIEEAMEVMKELFPVSTDSNSDEQNIDPDSVKKENMSKRNNTIYDKLCRGEIQLPSNITSKLKCFYYRPNNNLYLKLAPFRAEEAYPEPRLVIYHDVIDDKEIEILKKAARSKLKRATIAASNKPTRRISDFRIGKNAWISETAHASIKKINKRLADMTGLSMETAEELQVLNYGVGGFYSLHYDFMEQCRPGAKYGHNGNRLATILLYLSDVAQGGATVFPQIYVSLWPKKGSAAFWYNLHHNGEDDYNTQHAGCPVLCGSKWVANKWIHERGQEFIKPCGLKQSPKK